MNCVFYLFALTFQGKAVWQVWKKPVDLNFWNNNVIGQVTGNRYWSLSRFTTLFSQSTFVHKYKTGLHCATCTSEAIFFDTVNNVALHLNRLDFYSRFVCNASIDTCGCVLFVSGKKVLVMNEDSLIEAVRNIHSIWNIAHKFCRD